MKIFSKLLFVALLAQVSAAALAAEPPRSGANVLQPVAAKDFQATSSTKDKKNSGIREHLNLKPVTAKEFKAGSKKNGNAGPSVRNHLNLRPVTADEFKHINGTPRQ